MSMRSRGEEPNGAGSTKDHEQEESPVRTGKMEVARTRAGSRFFQAALACRSIQRGLE